MSCFQSFNINAYWNRKFFDPVSLEMIDSFKRGMGLPLFKINEKQRCEDRNLQKHFFREGVLRLLLVQAAQSPARPARVHVRASERVLHEHNRALSEIREQLEREPGTACALFRTAYNWSFKKRLHDIGRPAPIPSAA